MHDRMYACDAGAAECFLHVAVQQVLSVDHDKMGLKLFVCAP
jgi:hypothetical protein